MLPPIQIAQQVVAGLIGKELLAELWATPWDSPRFKAVEAFGVAAGTHSGTKRSRNEDRFAFAHVTAHSGDQFAVAIVCDGVGGSESGDAAATIAIAALIGQLAQLRQRLPLGQLLPNLIRAADDAVREALQGRGTTTASVLIASSSGQAAAANIGDSRIYSWNPSTESLQQVSIDDTMERELADLPVKDASILDARGLRGRLSQAIGEGERDSMGLRIAVFDSDRFPRGAFLATDGAWKADVAGLELIVRNAGTASDAVRRTISFALWTGGSDNISVIAIDDVKKLSAACRDIVRPPLGSARATVWLGETKLVLYQPEGRLMQQDVLGNPPPKERPAQKDSKKRPRKTMTRGSGARTRSVDPQLPFPEETSTTNAPERPKVVISTDDDTKTKTD